MRSHGWTTYILGSALLAAVAHAQTLHGDALAKALRQGGYVIVMRHTSSPRDAPSKRERRERSA